MREHFVEFKRIVQRETRQESWRQGLSMMTDSVLTDEVRSLSTYRNIFCALPLLTKLTIVSTLLN